MISVYRKEYIPENCATCLYGPNAVGYDGQPLNRYGCAHADRQGDWMMYMIYAIYALDGCKCPSYWLDQNRFQEVK